jgi:hypothetical protein
MLKAILAGLMSMPQPVPDRLLAVGAIVHARFPEFHGFKRTSLQHLTYLIQVRHMQETGQRLFPDFFEATAMGPGIPRLDASLRRKRPSGAREVHRNSLSEEEIAFVESACDELSGITGAELVATTSRRGGGWARNFGNWNERIDAGFRCDRGNVIGIEDMRAEYETQVAA